MGAALSASGGLVPRPESNGGICWGDSGTVAPGWQYDCHPNDVSHPVGRGTTQAQLDHQDRTVAALGGDAGNERGLDGRD